ncbi:hypothetical protein FAM09_29725 [Niastella caeni]|uniref:DUF5977 domain-containing protein n=1 Tax=Niastella caeni TaxID=2569763 RepID=A0A4S8HDX0_9BACT|nr:DUF5977 domain-containing protein [Niastella caeni]THU30782.1 hypothetical protein FAM09_29725 [Niastella caeni]
MNRSNRIDKIAILLLSLASIFFTKDVHKKSAVPDVLFHGGCITSGNQTIVIGTLPGTITATAASGGNCNGVYTYQWLMSTDGVFYSEIPGATGQNLTFSSATAHAVGSIVLRTEPPPLNITFYQRRATCGSEEKYTSFVTVTQVEYITYYNVAKNGTFTRNNCGSGYEPTSVTYTVNARTYTSRVSQAAADQLAQDDVNANGQAYANTWANCRRIYYNAYRSQVFTRNNCTGGDIGTNVTYWVDAGTKTSLISQADADQKAQNEIDAYGQWYANVRGSCVSPNISIIVTNQTNEQFTATYTNTATGTTYFYYIYPNVTDYELGPIPKGTYNVAIRAPNNFTLYEWIFSNNAYYLAGSNTYILDGMDLTCDHCGRMDIYYY